MMKIHTDLIKEAVYELCFKANTCLNFDIYSKILNAYKSEENSETKNYLKNILENAKIAYETGLPLCQDTGQVIVFLEIGQNIQLEGGFIYDCINSAVEECYREKFFRKSVVKNAVFDRVNTKTNTPCIIYTNYVKTDNVKISVLIKGAGSENKSRLKMLLPTINKEELIKECSEMILNAGLNSCPPMFIGIGIGATADKALLLSKEALLETDFTKEELVLSDKIKTLTNKNAIELFKNCFVLDVKLKTASTHIACMPVAVTINCHSDRYSSALISDDKITYFHKTSEFTESVYNKKKKFVTLKTNKVIKEIKTNDIDTLKTVKEGESILLTGEIYVARDMAHKKMIELLKEGKSLPFNIKDKIIFYAGPCPCPEDKITGSIGPTTAERMDKYAVELYKEGLFATIGKGNRSKEIEQYLKKTGKKYFITQGGIAALLAKKVTKSEIIAFSELGTEAVYKINVNKFPVKLN